jgi:hypothetical protein
MIKFFMKNAAKSLLAAALVAVICLSFASCKTPGGAKTQETWLSAEQSAEYSMPKTKPAEASAVTIEVDKDKALIVQLNWSATGRGIDAWLASEGWRDRDPASGPDSKGNVAYTKLNLVLAYGIIGTNHYVIVVSK